MSAMTKITVTKRGWVQAVVSYNLPPYEALGLARMQYPRSKLRAEVIGAEAPAVPVKVFDRRWGIDWKIVNESQLIEYAKQCYGTDDISRVFRDAAEELRYEDGVLSVINGREVLEFVLDYMFFPSDGVVSQSVCAFYAFRDEDIDRIRRGEQPASGWVPTDYEVHI